MKNKAVLHKCGYYFSKDFILAKKKKKKELFKLKKSTDTKYN